LFDPITLRGVTAKNRLMLSPMCQYSASEGVPTAWHMAHLGRFALGGFGSIVMEAAAVSRDGRITHGDLGIWSDDHIEPLRQIVRFLQAQGAVVGIQLAHAGRKASSQRPWEGNAALTADVALPGEPPWPTVAASAIPVTEGWPAPQALSLDGMRGLVSAWAEAARRADRAGFDLIEIHAAHGYLLHTFLSPLANKRNDAYGGDLAGRMRFPLEVVEAARAAWPENKPLSVRISAVDGPQDGTSIEDSIVFARELKSRGVDIVDCSSGGVTGGSANARIPRGFGYQIPLSREVRKQADIPTIAVGLITTPQLANDTIVQGDADIIAMGREALLHPNWPHIARQALAGQPIYSEWPEQAGWWLDKREWALEQARAQARLVSG